MDSTAMLSMSDASYYLAPRSYMDRVSVSAVAAAVLALAAVPFALASLPVVYGVISLASVVLLAALASRMPVDEPVSPTRIEDGIARATYTSLLAAHIELAKTLERAGERHDFAERVLGRSRDLILACGRVAETTNAAARYLGVHDITTSAADEARLHRQAASGAPATSPLLAAAAQASARRHAATVSLDQLRAHARARLELALASLNALTAAVVKRLAFQTPSTATADEALAVATDELRDHADAIEAAGAM